MNTLVSKSNRIAASIAHESTPLQPPDIMMGFEDEMDLINASIDDLSHRLREPTTANFICTNIHGNLENVKHLHHFSHIFMGCFSIKIKSDINLSRLLDWKVNSSSLMTIEIGQALIPYISQYYDIIVTAPPSANRDWDNYCCFKLCQYVSNQVNIPFVIAFQQRTNKTRHGRFESIRADLPQLMPDFNYHHKSILFVDDVINSGVTARTCFAILHNLNNHVDGLIYCHWR